MPRRVQDIIPSDRRSIREISLSSKTKKNILKSKVNDVTETSDDNIQEKILPRSIKDKITTGGDITNSLNNHIPPKRMPIAPLMTEVKPKRRLNKWLIAVLLIVFGIALAGYFASVYYSKATFTIVPKSIPLTVNGNYVAQPSSGSGLYYDVITLNKSATTTTPSTNGPLTNTKATGKVTLYNSYSNQSVRLIAGTRLSSENGLVYRLSSSVVIPGYTKSGSNIVPGKLVTNVVADQPGQNYNIPLNEDLMSFKVVAYAGSPRYTTIYASQSTAITGGYSGVKKNVSQANLASSTSSLKTMITDELLKEIKSSIPDGFVMYDNSYTINFGSPNIGGGGTDTADITINGTINAIVLPKDKLTETLVGPQAIALFEPFSYTSPGLESLNVVINNIKDFSLTKKPALVFNMKGDMKVVGIVPVEEIKNKLLGIPLSQTQEIFKSYGAVIEKSEGELAPPWADIPTDPERVKIMIEDQ